MVGALAIDIVAYTYDNLDRVKTMRYNDVGVLVTYTYDYMGNVAVAKVTNTAKTEEYATYSYEYDSLGRLTRYFETLEDEIVQQVETTYDSKNRAASYAYFDGVEMRTIEYTYNNDNSGVLTRYDYGEDGALGYSYDALNRVTRKFIRHDAEDGTDWTVAYKYKAGSATNQTTSLISQMKYTIGSENYTFNYTYDNLGNITEVRDAGGNTVAKYMYDELNQLQLEEVYNGSESYTMLYDYDTFGNLLSAKKYQGVEFGKPSDTAFGTLLSTETYGYTDSSWKDLLTSYNGTSITYDTIGNPLSYNNGQSYTFTWEKGRQLASAVTSGKAVTFEYNADGIRTEKHVSGTADYYYRLDGDKVVEMVKDGFEVHDRYVFLYDNEGKPHALYYYYNGSTTPTKYYYVLNLQGDVVQLRDSSYAVVANYTYDAWGKLLSVTNASGAAITSSTNIANINPIRYRGYFYDTETKLYYCNSRYYDPQIKRFINADELLSTGTGFLGYNMFAYCLNNPVNMDDDGGQWPGKIHEEVLKHVMYKYSITEGIPIYKEQIIIYSPNTVVSTLHAYGRADLINEFGYVWEIKRNRGNQVEKGKKQIENYIINTWKAHPEKELHKGYPIASGHFEFTEGYTKYEVKYDYMGDGVIGYDYTTSRDWDKIEDTAKDVAADLLPFIIVAGAAALGYLIGGPAGAAVGSEIALPVFG